MALNLIAWTVVVCTALLGVLEAYTLRNSNDEKDTCSYSFQVWKPDSDVLQRLREVEILCSNITSSVDIRMLSLRNHIITEVLNNQNVSQRLEKEILGQKLQHVQQKIDLKDMGLDLVELRGDNRKIWDAVRNLQDGVLSGSFSRGLSYSDGENPSGANRHQIRQRYNDEADTSLLSQLKNSVGDLKAEWLLFKREVNDIKSEYIQMRFRQDDLKTDTVKLKSLIEGMKSQTGLIRNELDDISVTQEALQKRATDSGATGQDTDISSLRNELIEIRGRYDELESQLVHLSGINDEIRGEALNVLSGHKNITVDDITRLLRKMSAQLPPGAGNIEQEGTPKDCHDVYRRGARVSAVYRIQPDGTAQPDNVYCEMVDHVGWTVLSRRQDGTLSFNKGWIEYKHGFGNMYGEFWIGNENIHRLTQQKRYKLRVDLWDWEGTRSYAEYAHFTVGDEETKYTVKVRDYQGTAGDSLSYHDDMAFSTTDSDNDSNMRNCAEDNKSGWWYHSCYSSNLNGLYHVGWYTKSTKSSFSDGIVWYTLKESEFYSLRGAEMKIRPLYLT